MRLQKYLSQQGVCSRREAEDLIKNGAVKVNGKKTTLGDKWNLGDVVSLHGKEVGGVKPKQVFLAFHKPQGVETTLREIEEHKSLADFDFGALRVFAVGRLDKESRGLLLMTNDGDMANTLMHPKFGHEKEYIVTVNKKLREADLVAMRKGVQIETGMTHPCKVDQIFEKAFSIILTEGKKRQIRRMCKALGYNVLDLVRVRVENIKLGELKAGKWRHLTEGEIAQICTKK